MNTKSVSITHLVFGLIFLGVTALWAVGATTDLEAPALAIWGPAVLIAAGLVGLAATVFNARNARTTAVPADHTAVDTSTDTQTRTTSTGPTTTGGLDHEEQS